MHLTVTPSELMIGMLVVLAAVALLAEKIRIAYPILLVLAGLAIGVVPVYFPSLYAGEDLVNGRSLFLKPDIVFLVFLPPLLYYAGFLTTWRDFKANIHAIAGLAFGLVLVTMVAVAVVAHALLPHFSWACAFLLGAIVSPPDAIAATAVLEKLHVPKRVVAILEGESLVNDATALVAYKIALGAIGAATGFSMLSAGGSILYVGVVGVGIGLGAAWVMGKLLEVVNAPAVESTLSLLVPFAAYLPAEKVHASGVLAAVAAGIYMGRRLPEIGSARQRLRIMAVWESLVFLLNGIIFILIGLQLYRTTVRGLQEMHWPRLMLAGTLISLVAVVVRLGWVYPAAYLPVLRAAPEKRPNWRAVTVVGWAGMRGIVSLAAALALPEEGVPGRDLIIFFAFFVILVTLVFQGLTLRPLIHLLGIEVDEGDERMEETRARLDAAHAAISRLAILGIEESDLDPRAVERVRAEYDERIVTLGGTPPETLGNGEPAPEAAVRKVRHEALIAERKMITFLRDQNELGDEILRRILTEIDLAEAKLLGQ